MRRRRALLNFFNTATPDLCRELADILFAAPETTAVFGTIYIELEDIIDTYRTKETP